MKQAILNRTQLGVLENALIRHGNIVTFADLAPLIPAQAAANKRQFVKQLADTGWLVRIKRGLYQIAELSTLGMLTLSRYTVAQLLVEESYVSFETALQYHGMYDQLPGAVVSVARQQHAVVILEGIRYRTIKTSDKYYFGWQEVAIDGRICKIATAEKVLIDLIQFHRTRLSVNLVAEKLAVFGADLDMDRLKAFLVRSNLATLRIFGHMLDILGEDTNDLWEISHRSTTVSRIAANSRLRDTRWRLLVDGDTVTA